MTVTRYLRRGQRRCAYIAIQHSSEILRAACGYAAANNSQGFVVMRGAFGPPSWCSSLHKQHHRARRKAAKG